jgi:hypothetical protein
MFRAITLMAMAGGFLAISPSLRDSLLDGYTQAGTTMEVNSPYSYIALGGVLVLALMVFLYKSAQPR